VTLARAIAAAALLAGACGPSSDHFGIHLQLTQGSEYRCPSPVCTGIPLACNAVVSLRIVDAADPTLVYLSKCLPINNATNLCGVGALDLGVTNPVPNRMVRVEVLVWPRVAVPDLMCPADVEFDARNMPVSIEPAPAIGGQSYFMPGSSSTADVELGCIDITALSDASCRAPGTVSVGATVDDFNTGVTLSPNDSVNVSVAVGEPKARTNPDTQQIEWELGPSDVTTLDRIPTMPVPTWRNMAVEASFQRAACILVLQDGPQETPAITCHAASKDQRELEFRSFRLLKQTLAEAFNALRLPGVPDQGIVVGKVVDHNGNPLAGVTVIPSAGRISFIATDGTVDPGNVTTSTGMFVSRDVPFDATWSASDGHGNGPSEKPVIGGLVAGKATVVFIQLEPPVSTQQAR